MMKETIKQPIHNRRKSFSNAALPLLVRSCKVSGGLARHDHDFIEASVITGGAGIHVSVLGEQNVKAGDAFIMRPGTWHSYTECQNLKISICGFGPELLKNELAWTLNDSALNHLLRRGPLSAKRFGVFALKLAPVRLAACRQHFKAIQKAETAPLGRAEMIGRLLLFLTELARAARQSDEDNSPNEAPLHRAVAAGIDLIEEHLARPWTLEDLSKKLHIERSYFVRLFKSQMGMPPIAYLSKCRAERAAVLLAQTNFTMTAIGNEVGWLDANYFSRSFKSHFGIAPTLYRRQLSNRMGKI